jgi:hypothetical protein
MTTELPEDHGDPNATGPLALKSNLVLGPLLESSGLLACIDDAYLDRGDWQPLVQAFADAVSAAERERSEVLRQALLKCKTCALPTEVRFLVNAALRA